MAKNILKYLNKLANYLNVPVGKINLREENKYIFPTRIINNQQYNGTLNIITSFLTESNSNLSSKDHLENAEIRQWLEYSSVYVNNCQTSQDIKQILTELNNILETRTYLVSHRLTVADLFLYYILLEIMKKLTYIEKEKYINVSRWFENIQQNVSERQSSEIIDFSTIYLPNIVSLKVH